MIAVILRRITKVVPRGLITILWPEIFFLAAVQVVCVLSTQLVMETFQAECMIGDHDIVLWNKGYSGCIDECRARAECETINVHVRLRMCRMHMQDTGTLMPCDDETGFLFSEKKNWKQKTLPGCDDASCGPGQKCEVAHDEETSHSCVFRECPTMQEPLNAITLGNERSIGARVCFSCVAVYPRALLCLQCEKNGTWKGASPQCVCSDYLISGPNGVPDDSLSASSSWNANAPALYSPNWARLNTTETAVGNGAWSAGKNDINQWIQAHFNISKTVKAIAIQGRDRIVYTVHSQYVTEFTVSYSADCINFQDISDADGEAMKFIGNSDWNTIETRMLPILVTGRCVRLHPTKWNEHISLRWDIIGC